MGQELHVEEMNVQWEILQLTRWLMLIMLVTNEFNPQPLVSSVLPELITKYSEDADVHFMKPLRYPT